MADIYSVEKRSDIMSKIKSKNTKPELKMARALSSSNIDYVMHASLIGKPDFVLRDMGIILFVDGEFWHGHTLTPEKRAKLSEYWVKKLDANVRRDKRVTSELTRQGWHVIRVTDRVVNKSAKSVISKIRRADGQLCGKGCKIEPTSRIAALRELLNQNK